MNLRQYLVGKNLWLEIKNVGNFEFILDHDQMDLMLSIEYGDRTIFEGFENISAPVIAELINTHFATKWDALVSAKLSEIDITSADTKKTKTSIEVLGNKTGDENTDNKISGFNTNELITDGGTETNRNEDTEQSTDTEKTETIASYSNLFNNLSTVEQSNIITLALKDVKNYLTISIY